MFYLCELGQGTFYFLSYTLASFFVHACRTGGYASPFEPAHSVVHLHLPDAPRVVAALQVEVVGDMQRVQLTHEAQRIFIVRLVLRRRAEVDMQLPRRLVAGQRIGRTVLLHVRGIMAPDRPLGAVVATKRDDGAEDVGMVHSDI